MLMPQSSKRLAIGLNRSLGRKRRRWQRGYLPKLGFLKTLRYNLELQAHMISLVKMISLAWKGVHIFGTNKLKEMMSLPYCRKPHPLTAPKSLRGDIASKRECLPLIIGKEIFGNGMAVAMNRCRPRKSMPRCGLS